MEANCYASKAPDPLQPLSPVHQPGERHLSMGAQRLAQCYNQNEGASSYCVQGNYTGYMHLSCALKEAEEAGIELQPPVSLFCLLKFCLWCQLAVLTSASHLCTHHNCSLCSAAVHIAGSVASNNAQLRLTSGSTLKCRLSCAGMQALEQARILLVQGEMLLQASS